MNWTAMNNFDHKASKPLNYKAPAADVFSNFSFPITTLLSSACSETPFASA
jgi:hypothetical protein